MEKKTLNLNFVELEPRPGGSNVCLMPCPCSGSYSYPATTYQGTGGLSPQCLAFGWAFGKVADAFIEAAINKGKGCQAEQAAASLAAECGYDIDYGGTTNLGPSCGCAGGVKG